MPATALYDLDHTLLSCDSDYEWGRFLAASGTVDADAYQQRNAAFYAEYRHGAFDPYAYLEFVLAPLGRIEHARLLRLRERFLQAHIRPCLRPGARRLLAAQRDDGFRQIIVTSTNAFIAEPIAQLLDVDTLIAPQPEMRDGRYTGKLSGGACFGADKPRRIAAWAAQAQVELGETWGYSDSIRDRPLLEFVDHPVAVDPEPDLRAHAQRQGWDIISLEDPA